MIHIEAITVISTDEQVKILTVVEIEEKESYNVKAAFEKEFKIIKCRHEHDCCGCAHRNRIEHITLLHQNVYSALITYWYNV